MTGVTSRTDIRGDRMWYHNGLLHRDGDLPAIEYANGTKCWYQNDKRHRDGDLPAIIHASGGKAWCQNDKQHRSGIKPAFESGNGNYKKWYKYDISYSLEQLITYYSRLARFGKHCIAKIRLMRLKHKRWIHGELLCKPPRGNYPGGQDYHKMVGYFMKLV